jgi:hypothetical protein
MAVRWEDFYQHVQPHVPGCPEIVVESHVREAAIDFCERSEVWTYRGLPFQTSSGTADYFVDILPGSLLENLASVHVDGFLAMRVSPLHSGENPTAPYGMPHRYCVFEDQQIRFFPTPDRAYEVQTLAVLKPSLSSRGVEDFIFETHGRTIACGAIASLSVIPGKEWSNPELAAYYKAKFLRETDDAKGRTLRRSNLRARGARFA